MHKDGNMERLDKQFDFFREIDKEKEITRHTFLADASRRENDAEHAWHMAIMTILLSEYANDEIDVLKTVTMLLIHDIVEIDAGDTYAYDEKGKETQAVREKMAADRIFHLLPEDQAEKLYNLWCEFEAQETAEAKFARCLDNIQPMMLNDASNGLAWEENEIKLSQILKRNEKTAEGSKVLWNYMKRILQKNVEEGHIRKDTELLNGD